MLQNMFVLVAHSLFFWFVFNLPLEIPLKVGQGWQPIAEWGTAGEEVLWHAGVEPRWVPQCGRLATRRCRRCTSTPAAGPGAVACTRIPRHSACRTRVATWARGCACSQAACTSRAT